MIYLKANGQSNIDKGKPVYETNISLLAGETSEPIMLNDGEGKVDYWNIAIIPGAGGSGYAQYSLSPRVDVENNVGNWITWDNGTVLSLSASSFFPVTAVRFVCVAGAISGEVLVS